mmetsp:Transcript_13944/g.30104  ORF Transcript_13944/g.30104 Transcript_13944/m.30104 type:complete len:200 (+) Transcript_13944:212-811(+)
MPAAARRRTRWLHPRGSTPDRCSQRKGRTRPAVGRPHRPPIATQSHRQGMHLGLKRDREAPARCHEARPGRRLQHPRQAEVRLVLLPRDRGLVKISRRPSQPRLPPAVKLLARGARFFWRGRRHSLSNGVRTMFRHRVLLALTDSRCSFHPWSRRRRPCPRSSSQTWFLYRHSRTSPLRSPEHWSPARWTSLFPPRRTG